jgi:hypothetical protein
VQGEFICDNLETAVGPIFTGHESKCKCATEWGATLYRGGVSVVGVCSGSQCDLRRTLAGEGVFEEKRIPVEDDRWIRCQCRRWGRTGG